MKRKFIAPAKHLPSDYKQPNCEFNMNSIPLLNYLPQLDDSIKVVGFEKVLKDCHLRLRATKVFVAKKAGIHFVTYFNYLSGKNRCSLAMLKKLSVIYGKDLIETAYEGGYLFLSKKKSVNLPRTLTPELAYYIGYLQGDGCLDSNRKVVDFCDE
ncbi:MAG: helix-turn-helix transcriptional regulator [Candidatus Diapherotrites archaeon]|nr:helix-turn-helix transcriptional regulator [Candidatus Diapherotrites archaeon]